MATVRENLIAAKEVYEANEPRWTFHMAVDYSSGDETDEDYRAMMKALEAAAPQVPPLRTDLVRWSKFAGKEAIISLFDRAIAVQPES